MSANFSCDTRYPCSVRIKLLGDSRRQAPVDPTCSVRVPSSN